MRRLSSSLSFSRCDKRLSFSEPVPADEACTKSRTRCRDGLAGQAMTSGLSTLFCRHTSASLLIQENAAREVRTDLEAFFEQLAPEAPAAARMTMKGRMICLRIFVRRLPRCSFLCR